MNLVLAIEPDSSQADPLSSVVRTKLGAELVVVTSAYAAIVAMNQRIPDVVLFGRAVSQDQRTKIVTHLKSLTDESVRTIDIPELANGAPPERSGLSNLFRKKEAAPAGADIAGFTKQVGVSLAAAEDARSRKPKPIDAPAAPAQVSAAPGANVPKPAAADESWDEVPLEAGDGVVPKASQKAPIPPVVEPPRAEVSQAEIDSDIRSADISLIEAEVEFRLKTELERVHAEAAQQQARELARVEAAAAEQRARDLARIESEAAVQRESAVFEAKAAAEAATRAALAAEVESARREAEQQLASEVARVRIEAEQALAAHLGQRKALSEQEKAQSEQERDAEMARARADAEAAAARALEEQVARVKAETDARLEAEIARVKAESEAELARARDEAERVRDEAARARDEAERARDEAERARALEAEVARVKAETDARLQEEIARTRAETEAEVARAAAETAARLEAELARVKAESEAQLARAREDAERARLAHQQAAADSENIHEVAARELRAAAEDAALRALEEQGERLRARAEAELAAETERIRAEGEKRLEAEVAGLRAAAERQQAKELEDARKRAADAAAVAMEVLTRERHIAWKPVLAAAAVIVIVGGGFMLRSAISSAARTSSALVGSATRAATEAASKAKNVAASAAPTVKKALSAAERAASARAKTATSAQPEALSVAPAAETEPAGPGFLVAFSRIPMDLYADGRRVGSTEDGQIILPSGSHKIEFVSERFHYRSTVTMTIRPGETTSHTLALPSGQVHVTTTPGAEVWVEGERVGVAPMEAIAVPIGTREVIVKDPSFGERRESVEVKYGTTAELTLMPAATTADPAAPRLAPLSQYAPK